MRTPDDLTTVVVLTTMPDEDAAGELASHLVEEREIACANIVPGVTSIYRWEGELKRDTEVLLVMKTTSTRAETLQVRIDELHPYDVPEVLVLSVTGGHPPYLAWVASEVAV